MIKRENLGKVLIIAFAIFVSSFSLYVWQIFRTPNLQIEQEKAFVLFIPENGTYESVLDTLKKHKVINDEVSFRFLAKLLKYPQIVKAGRYEIRPDMGNYATIKKLKLGEQDPVKLTFNNVRLKEDLIAKIGNKFQFPSDSLAALLNSSAFCQQLGFNSETVMCMFIPNTYEIFWNTTPKNVLERMKTEYLRFWNKERQQKAHEIGLSPIQVQILASIVEGETKKNDEKPRVAGAYINRLNTNMPLQSDPTVIFALKDFTIKRLLKYQLAVNSPYNTYRNTGLPPGLINLPNANSIDAVLNYEHHNYTYFCASPDLNGYHTFAGSYTEHLHNAKLYQEALDKMGIKK